MRHQYYDEYEREKRMLDEGRKGETGTDARAYEKLDEAMRFRFRDRGRPKRFERSRRIQDRSL